MAMRPWRSAGTSAFILVGEKYNEGLVVRQAIDVRNKAIDAAAVADYLSAACAANDPAIGVITLFRLEEALDGFGREEFVANKKPVARRVITSTSLWARVSVMPTGRKMLFVRKSSHFSPLAFSMMALRTT